MKMIITKNILFVLFVSLLLSGCIAAELAEALAVEDVAAVAAEESVYLRSASVIRLSATEGAIVDDIASLNSSLRRIRLAPSTNYSASHLGQVFPTKMSKSQTYSSWDHLMPF